jgi:hypothetical protein
VTTQPLATRPLTASPTVSGDPLPDPHVWAAHIAQAILDTLFGTRPAHQLVRWTDPAVYSAILSATSVHVRTPGAPRPAVRSIRVSMPVARAAEASVVLQVGPRYRAAAMRLESVGNRWLCTTFELI